MAKAVSVDSSRKSREAIGPGPSKADSEDLSEIDAMAVAQPVSAPLTRAALFLVVTINPGPDNREAVRSFCSDLLALIRAVEFRDLEAGLSCVMGIGSDDGPAVRGSTPS